MPTRREVIALAAAAAAVSAMGLDAWAAPALSSVPADSDGPDRELELRISDGFASQRWSYAGQTWAEARERLTLFEDEFVNITVRNDTDGDHVVNVADTRMTKLAPGERIVLPFFVQVGQTDRQPISVVAEDGARLLMELEVRLNYGAHALVAV